MSIPTADGNSSTAHQSVIQYWVNPEAPADLPPCDLGTDSVCLELLDPSINAFLQDIKGYVQHFEELDPGATVGLIYHAQETPELSPQWSTA